MRVTDTISGKTNVSTGGDFTPFLKMMQFDEYSSVLIPPTRHELGPFEKDQVMYPQHPRIDGFLHPIPKILRH